MSSEEIIQQQETLGVMFRRVRLEQGKAEEEVVNECRISLKTLQAIEEDDYDNLPADAFARGQYVLFAKYLGLDPDEVLNRYTEQRPNSAAVSKQAAHPSTKDIKRISTLAQPPSIAPRTGIGVTLLALIIIGSLGCWYFSWNPASYISQFIQQQKSKSAPVTDDVKTEDDSAQELEIIEQHGVSALSAPPPEIKQPLPTEQALAESVTDPGIPADAPAYLPEIITETVTGEEPSPAATEEPTGNTPPLYVLEATFSNDIDLSISLDNDTPLQQSFKAGEQTVWQAHKGIDITLPEGSSGVELRLNDVAIPITRDGTTITNISLPADLLN
ncbi:MAG: helix-turn-helix domain-containing protein [Thermodesulfobacteriota bacterium]